GLAAHPHAHVAVEQVQDQQRPRRQRYRNVGVERRGDRAPDDAAPRQACLHRDQADGDGARAHPGRRRALHSGRGARVHTHPGQQRSASTIIAKNTALITIALPDDITAASAPASAGPIARATLYATEDSAIACGSSWRDTNSLMLAPCAGM